MTADELKEWRMQLGLSQPELAALLEVHPLTVSAWECGRRPLPPLLTLALVGLRAQLAAE